MKIRQLRQLFTHTPPFLVTSLLMRRPVTRSFSPLSSDRAASRHHGRRLRRRASPPRSARHSLHSAARCVGVESARKVMAADRSRQPAGAEGEWLRGAIARQLGAEGRVAHVFVGGSHKPLATAAFKRSVNYFTFGQLAVAVGCWRWGSQRCCQLTQLCCRLLVYPSLQTAICLLPAARAKERAW